ncbi:hypothetical protein LPJ78_002186 [Coemansia sp. RSA 989]|nr:hypothetical protein BX667DRAFT_512893 [Coemansia mojavensis]KAJ1866090.1 hypothetical protein LPJ78_002186 [Coemansia sp. RSA 989]
MPETTHPLYDGKYAVHTSSVNAVSWAEIAGGLLVLVFLLAGLAFIASAFMLATIGVGQLELRAVILLKNWYVSGPLAIAFVALVLVRRHLLWRQFKAAGASNRANQ